MIGRRFFKAGKNYKYLGSEISEGGEITKPLKKERNLSQAVTYYRTKDTREGQVGLLCTRSTVLSGKMGINERNWIIFQAGEMKFIRAVKGKTRRGKERNSEIRSAVNVECMREMVEKKSIRWYTCVKKMGEEGLPIKIKKDW